MLLTYCNVLHICPLKIGGIIFINKDLWFFLILTGSHGDQRSQREASVCAGALLSLALFGAHIRWQASSR